MTDAQNLPALTPEGEAALRTLERQRPVAHVERGLLTEIRALHAVLLRHEQTLGGIVVDALQNRYDKLDDFAYACQLDYEDRVPVVRLRATKEE